MTSKDIKLTLYEVSNANEIFPIDEFGIFEVHFDSKFYKFPPSNTVRYCECFKKSLTQEHRSLSLQLKTSNDEEAFDLVMKLLYGFKDVIIPENKLYDVLLILNELGVNDKTNFKQKAEQAIFAKLHESLILDAFQAGITLHKESLISGSLDLLAQHHYKQLIDYPNKLNSLSEESFCRLLESLNEWKKKSGSSEDKERFPSLQQVKAIIEFYCDENYRKDSNLRHQKLSKFRECVPICYETNQIEQTSANPDGGALGYLNSEKSLVKQIEVLCAQMVRLDRQNEQLRKENQLLKQDLSFLTTTMKEFQEDYSVLLKKELNLIREEITTNINTQILETETRINKNVTDSMGNIMVTIQQRFDGLLGRFPGAPGSVKDLDKKEAKVLSTAASINISDNGGATLLSRENSLIGSPTNKTKLIVDSSILLSESDRSKLKEWLPKPAIRLKLLYRGSQHGFKASKFHEFCGNIKPTLSVIKSEFGKVFGCYTEALWNGPVGHKRDDKAFIFSLSYQEKYPCINPDKAIYTFANYLIVNGEGHGDIWIQDNCHSHQKNFTEFPGSYLCPKFPSITEESKAYLAGNYQFTVEEIEVFQVL